MHFDSSQKAASTVTNSHHIASHLSEERERESIKGPRELWFAHSRLSRVLSVGISHHQRELSLIVHFHIILATDREFFYSFTVDSSFFLSNLLIHAVKMLFYFIHAESHRGVITMARELKRMYNAVICIFVLIMTLACVMQEVEGGYRKPPLNGSIFGKRSLAFSTKGK